MTGSVADCSAVREDLAGLALGTLGALERSVALDHVQCCSGCRVEVDRLSAAVDAVLLLAPALEPTPGFEARLFDRMGVRPQRSGLLSRRPARRLALATATVLVALGLGLGIGLTAGGPTPAASPVSVELTAGRVDVGRVYLAPGNPGWMFMAVDHLKVTGPVTCRVETAGGDVLTVGTVWIDGGAGSWAFRLPVPVQKVASASVVGAGGRLLATAAVH